MRLFWTLKYMTKYIADPVVTLFPGAASDTNLISQSSDVKHNLLKIICLKFYLQRD